MRIFAFHLLNDYSGSPKVLMQLVKSWIKQDIDVTIVTCNGRRGFLSDLPGADYSFFWYKWAANPVLRLFNLTLSQLLLLVKLFLKVKKEDVIYINTVLPFGAAFLGKLKGCRVIYHIHETSMKPALLKKLLFGIAKWSATEVIYVSKYLQEVENISNKKNEIIYNAIEDKFLDTAKLNWNHKKHNKNVLMICSLKEYKGVFEFVKLAQKLPGFKFRLVVNASQTDISCFFKTNELPANLEIFPTQTNTHPFYAWADVILNLSLPDGWIETFGLTIIEGMAYGLPAIVPPVGGITELVTEGVNGFKVDPTNIDQLSNTLNRLFENPDLYATMRKASLDKIHEFSEQKFTERSLAFLKTKSRFLNEEIIPDYGITNPANNL